MTWQRTVAKTAGKAVARGLTGVVIADPRTVRRRTKVDPQWRRLEDGYAPRLAPHTTIDVARPVGRWRHVDPRLPQDEWQSLWKAVGLGVWAGAVGIAWWLGSSRGRGPLQMLQDDADGWW